jgi:hypothetical protein
VRIILYRFISPHYFFTSLLDFASVVFADVIWMEGGRRKEEGVERRREEVFYRFSSQRF